MVCKTLQFSDLAASALDLRKLKNRRTNLASKLKQSTNRSIAIRQKTLKNIRIRCSPRLCGSNEVDLDADLQGVEENPDGNLKS